MKAFETRFSNVGSLGNELGLSRYCEKPPKIFENADGKYCRLSYMTWLHALTNNNAVKLKTTLPRIGQLGTKIYQQTCVVDG